MVDDADEADERDDVCDAVVVAVVRAPFGVLELLCPLRALATVSWAAARLACWAVTAACKAVVSSVASVWPAVTVWPGWTATLVTLPAIGKATVPWATGSMTPLRCSVWL